MKVKTKVSYASNPNGNLWMKDDSGFGQKMLAKMGWSSGQGLGRTNQGITKAISVLRKSDTRGVGCSRQWAEEGNAQMDAFADVLASLNSQGTESAEGEDEAKVGLEETSKNCRFRLHYGKFTRGKDLSRHSDDILKCIVGSRGIKSKDLKQDDQEAESKEEKDSSSGVQYVHSVVNMADYFKQKMAAKLSGLRSSESAPQLSSYDNTLSEDELDARPCFGAAFNPSGDFSYSGSLINSENHQKSTVKFEVGSSDEESKKSTVKFEVGSSDEESKKNKVKFEVENSIDMERKSNSKDRPSFCVGDSNNGRNCGWIHPVDVKEEVDDQCSDDTEERERRRKKKEKKKRRKREVIDALSEEETNESRKSKKSDELNEVECQVSTSTAIGDPNVNDASCEEIKDVKKSKKSKKRKKDLEQEVQEGMIEAKHSEKGEDTKKTKRRKRKKDIERESEEIDDMQEKADLTAFTPGVSERNKEIWEYLDDTVFSTSNLKRVDGYRYYTLDLHR